MTSIEWTRADDGSEGKVWNPTTGCDRVSAGCDHCYAMTMAKRLKGMGQPKYQNDGCPRTSGPGFGLTVHPDTLMIPLYWREPRRIFVNSMSDLFHAEVPKEFIAKMFAVMAACPQHTFQVLTKRHARMRSLLNSHGFWMLVVAECLDLTDLPIPGVLFDTHQLPNVWLGVSAEDQHWADIRIPALLNTPAAVRFVSAEPLLGPIDLTWCSGVNALHPDWAGGPSGGTGSPHPLLDWVIAGGESGRGARPCDLAWIRLLIDCCEGSSAAVFVKQLGSVLGREVGAGSKGGDWDHWPEDLRVREFPHTAEGVPV